MKRVKKAEAVHWFLYQIKSNLPPIFLLAGLSMAASLLGVFFVLTSRNVIDIATGVRTGNLLESCLLMIAVILLQQTLSIISSLLQQKTVLKGEITLKTRLLRNLLQKEWLALSPYHSGDLMTRFTSDVSISISAVFSMLPDTLALVTQLTASFFVLLSLDSTFALLVLFIGPALLVFGNFFSKKIKTYHRECQESESRARSLLQEILQNITLIKIFRQEAHSSDRVQSALRDNAALQMKKARYGAFSGAGLAIGFWFGYLFAIAWGSYRLSLGAITFGTMTAFLQLVGQIQSPFQGLSRLFPRLYSALASAERLLQIETLSQEPPAAAQDFQYLPLKMLKVQNLFFSYDTHTLLENVNLQFHSGQLIIITGPSGKGKTTLFRLFLGLLLPQTGTLQAITNDGTEHTLNNHTRSFFTYVPQGNSLLSGTLRENLLFGRPEALEKEIQEALQIAALDELVRQLPQGLDTIIGEKGFGLSEGQAQRVSIARAWLHPAPVLLLDEATSALDGLTEAVILENIKAALGERICLFISHRESVSASGHVIVQI